MFIIFESQRTNIKLNLIIPRILKKLDILGIYFSIHLRGPAFIQDLTFNRGEKTVIVQKQNTKKKRRRKHMDKKKKKKKTETEKRNKHKWLLEFYFFGNARSSSSKTLKVSTTLSKCSQAHVL